MGFTLTAAPKKRLEKNSTPREKTASGDFFQNPNESRLENRPQPLKTQQGTRAYSYKIVSGRPVWPSRDPIMEVGGENLYGFVFNEPMSYLDVLGRNPVPNGGMGPIAPFQNKNTNCGALAAFPNAVKGGAGGAYTPSPQNMTNPSGKSNKDGSPGAGCRKVKGASDCKKKSPDCERHVIVTVPKGEDFNGKQKPNYHAIGQTGCGSGYYQQVGGGGTILGPVTDPSAASKAYYDVMAKQKGQKAPELEETHYCCPKDS